MRTRVFALAIALLASCGSDGGTGGEEMITGQDAVDAGGEVVQPGQGPLVDDAPPPPMTTQACAGVEGKIGTGNRDYIEVKDGDTVFLFKGPQGGYMIYIGVRAKGLDRSLIYVDYEERLKATGKVFGVGQWKVQLTNDIGDGWFERVGIWGEIEPEYWTYPSFVRGQDVEMKVKLTDRNGCTIDNLGWWVHVDPERPL